MSCFYKLCQVFNVKYHSLYCVWPPACLALMRCMHIQYNCGPNSLQSPGWFGSTRQRWWGGGFVSSSDTTMSAWRQPLQALIGEKKYCRWKLKGPSVKIIHDMHIFPAWWYRWIRWIIKAFRLQWNCLSCSSGSWGGDSLHVCQKRWIAG